MYFKVYRQIHCICPEKSLLHDGVLGHHLAKIIEEYLVPRVINALWFLCADIVLPAKACMAFECICFIRWIGIGGWVCYPQEMRNTSMGVTLAILNPVILPGFYSMWVLCADIVPVLDFTVSEFMYCSPAC